MNLQNKQKPAWPVMEAMPSTGWTKQEEASLRILASQVTPTLLSSMTKVKAKKMAKGAIMLADALLDEL